MGSCSPSSSMLHHVVMLPFMAKGHAMPMLHLTRLLLRRGLTSAVTILATPREAPFIRAAVAGVPGAAVLELPFPSSWTGPQSMEELPSDGHESHFLDLVSSTSALRPAFADALARLEPKPDLLVHDGFLPWAKHAADALGVPRLVSMGIGAFSCYVALAVLLQKPHARVSSPWEPFEVHGLPGLRLTKADLHPPFDDPEPAGPHWDFVWESGLASASSRGTILNSFHEMESLYIDKMNQLENSPKAWPVGPLCLATEPPAVQTALDDADLAGWLDSRLAMNRPVLYVAFGSQAHLSRAQVEEVAAGLDRSGVDFVWVVRSKWFEGEDRVELEGRFGDRGKVVQGFVDQLGVLRHKAVKGFFSHCGWNSVTESISMGVPILAFPLAAEQKMNAKFVVDVIGAGLRVWPSNRGHAEGGGSEGGGGMVASQEDIGALARELILGEQGKQAAARAAELAGSARTAMDAGGSSFENLELMVRAVISGNSKVQASSE